MNIFDQVKSLNLPLGQYVVVGGGVLAAHGIRDFKDIDILITEELFDELKKNGWTVKVTSWGSNNVVNGIVEAGPSISSCKNYEPDITKVIKEADIINGIPFMDLHELMKFKKALGREKDLVDIALIKNYLKK
jgi:hypothetical protein